MGQVNQPSNVLDQIRDLRRELAEIRKAIGLTSATIQRGGLTLLQDAFLRMVDDRGIEILYAGPDDLGRQIVRLRREGGGDVLFTYTLGNGEQFWALTDRTGRILVSDDAVTGAGMARPWLPVPLYPRFHSDSTPTNTFPYAHLPVSSVPVETTLWHALASISHPKIQISGIWGTATEANTGTYRLKIAGTTVGTWTAGPLEFTIRGPFDTTPFVGTDERVIELTLTASGTGKIACQIASCYLRQS